MLGECREAYHNIVSVGGTKSWSEPGPERDAALLPLSCIPLLAYSNAGYSYPVFVANENGRDVIYLVGAPSGWYLDSVTARSWPNGIALDFGQNWYCINFQEVLDAIKGVPVA